MKSILKPSPLLLLIAAITVSCLIQFFCYWYDNKYTFPRPEPEYRRIRLNMDWYDRSQFFYLVEGWDFYDGKLLAPQDIGAHTPDDHFCIRCSGSISHICISFLLPFVSANRSISVNDCVFLEIPVVFYSISRLLWFSISKNELVHNTI